jgi:hypothetical protein
VPPARGEPAPPEDPPPAVEVVALPEAPAVAPPGRKFSKAEARRWARTGGLARRTRAPAAATAPSAPATEPPAPAAQEEAATKNGRPIYRGTQLQIEKNDPYR